MLVGFRFLICIQPCTLSAVVVFFFFCFNVVVLISES